MRSVMEQYAAAVTAGDVESILSFYSADGSCQVPVGGPVHGGIDAVRAFYEGNELAQALSLTGACPGGGPGGGRTNGGPGSLRRG